MNYSNYVIIEQKIKNNKNKGWKTWICLKPTYTICFTQWIVTEINVHCHFYSYMYKTVEQLSSSLYINLNILVLPGLDFILKKKHLKNIQKFVKFNNPNFRQLMWSLPENTAKIFLHDIFFFLRWIFNHNLVADKHDNLKSNRIIKKNTYKNSW